MFGRIVCTFFLVFSSIFSSVVYGNQGVVESEEQVRTFLNEALELAKKRDRSKAELKDRIIALFDKYMAIDFIASRVVGKKTWNKMNDAQRERFILLTKKRYGNMVYVSSFQFANGIFDITGVHDYDAPYKKGFLVKTKFFNNQRQRVEINFRLLRMKETHQVKIVDVQLEGISVLGNYRASIRSLLRGHNGDIDGFLEGIDPMR